jgi:serine/threonine protein kinase/TPR repeat protein
VKPGPDLDSIFCAAIEIESSEQRASYLDQACADTPELRERLAKLLDAHFKAGAFLQPPASDLYATVEGSQLSDAPGTVIGPYKLLQQIGEGGMGTVYMAEQTEPVRRLVALKLIKEGMDSRQIIARFEQERQALALMDHPNIAKVFDAGTIGPVASGQWPVVREPNQSTGQLATSHSPLATTGRPYFVMELVKGVPITKYCDEHHLTPRQRLELFIPVCQAVQHAHQKGIIHRDLKPSNVLVAQYDGKPVPKVIDFGVAKAAGPKLTDMTLFTELGAVVGTFEYMSPEQAELNQLDVDTRSDIYSLGVLLYELLTGTTPLERKRIKQVALLEVLRLIREEEPPKLSTRLSSTEALPSIAANRGSEPKKLTGLMRGEVDWIAMKALEKDRNRRYETASAFAADVQRYLNDETVQACPPSAAYRIGKLARRNKVALAMAALISGALVIAVAVLAFSNRRIAQEKHEKDEALQLATASELQAVTEAHRATIVADLLQQMLASANPETAKGANFTVRDLLDMFSSGLDDQVRDEPEVEATIRRTIGRAYWQLGMLDAAEHHLARTLDLRRNGIATEPKVLAQSLVDWAWVMVDQRKYALAGPALREALILYRGSDSAPQQILEALRVLQLVEIAEQRDSEVDQIAEEARKLATVLPGQQDPELACILFGLSRLRLSQGKLPEAERLARESVDMHRRTRAKDHPELAWGLFELGRALAKQEKYADAEKQFKEALVVFRKHYPNDRHYGPQLVIGELAGVLRAQNKQNEADALQREPARRLLEQLDNHPRDINSWVTIGETLQSVKIWDMALLAYQEAAKLAENADGPSRLRLAHGFRYVGRGLQAERRYAECELPYREASRWFEHILAESSDANDTNDLTDHLASTHAYFGWILNELNRLEEAVDAERKAISLWKQLGQAVPEGERHDWYAHEEAHFSTLLATILESLGRSQEALEYAQTGVRLHEQLASRHPDNKEHPRRLEGSQGILSKVLQSLGRADEAIAVYSKVIELEPGSIAARNNLAWLLATGPDSKIRDPKRAVELAKKAVELAPEEGTYWNTLGVSHYRAGDWKAAIAALEKSMELRKGGDSSDWFFLAMARWQLGDKKEARNWYDQAVEGMGKNLPKDEELRRFRMEAEQLLGMK